MALDPDFIKKVQERKAKREALEKKYASGAAASRSGSSRTSSGGSGSRRKTGPVYRSVSMLDGHEVLITGEDAKKRAQKGEYNG